jgi:hypothetical protein
VLLVVIGLSIATLGSFYAEPEDGKALRSLPKRLLLFLVGCSVVAGVLLICEHTFARV